jgi:hypothetical protein
MLHFRYSASPGYQHESIELTATKKPKPNKPKPNKPKPRGIHSGLY